MDEAKLLRIVELKTQRDAINEELAALLGGQPVKRKWTRKQEQGDGGSNPSTD